MINSAFSNLKKSILSPRFLIISLPIIIGAMGSMYSLQLLSADKINWIQYGQIALITILLSTGIITLILHKFVFKGPSNPKYINKSIFDVLKSNDEDDKHD